MTNSGMRMPSHGETDKLHLLGRDRFPDRGPRWASLAIVIAIVWVTLACAAAPALQRIAVPSATPDLSRQWSTAQIAKPRPTATATAPATAAAPASTLAPAATQTELAPTETAPPENASESPLITMVIVDEDLPLAESEQESPAPTGAGKYILVSISEQHLYAYENGQLVYSFVASTGIGNSTRVGTFQVLDKIPNAYGANWNIWMPNWLGIYWSGTLENGIHALPILPGGGRLWAGYLGAPVSYGCVVLGVDESMQLYDWAEIGTPVEIRW
jgi:lipoprotein-anchoring transpeptidase ErfK/SrfK